MESSQNPETALWFRQRLNRHVSEVLRLSWPVIVSRSSLMTMALVDTIMVGHYATQELAYLSIGIMPFMPVFLIMLGMVMGTVVVTSRALGAARFTDCGAALRRSLPYAFALGVLGFGVSIFGEELLLLSGQTEDLAYHGGRIMFILGLGLPAYLVTVTCSLFLEGIKRPKPAMVAMLVANIFNVGLNWVLIYGHLGMPALGAEGSAITSASLRWMLAGTILIYIWNMADQEKFGVRLAPARGWRVWAEQRRIGYSAAVSIGGESVSFAVIGLFAGWLGTVPLAAYSIIHNMISMAFMVSLGVGSATVVRVSIARGRGDRADMRLAGWTGLGDDLPDVCIRTGGVGIGLQRGHGGHCHCRTVDRFLRRYHHRRWRAVGNGQRPARQWWDLVASHHPKYFICRRLDPLGMVSGYSSRHRCPGVVSGDFNRQPVVTFTAVGTILLGRSKGLGRGNKKWLKLPGSYCLFSD